MTTPNETYACTLDEAGARTRLDQAQDLTARLVHRERRDRRLVLTFEDDGETSALVEAFVRDESDCCAFFGFDVRHDGDTVVLELTAPEGAEPMLDAAMASFDPGLDDTGRLALHRENTGPTEG